MPSSGREEDARRQGGLARLKRSLNLASMPHRIECFDISLFRAQHRSAPRSLLLVECLRVVGMGVMRSRASMGWTILQLMREVLVRRLRRGLEEEDLPDLIVVDGGKGQLNVALAVLETSESMGSMWLVWQKRCCGMGDASDAVMRSSERVFVPSSGPYYSPASYR